jgi:hypothetical protein
MREDGGGTHLPKQGVGFVTAEFSSGRDVKVEQLLRACITVEEKECSPGNKNNKIQTKYRLCNMCMLFSFRGRTFVVSDQLVYTALGLTQAFPE